VDKFSRGLRLARTSFRVVAADPVILLVLLAGVIGAVGLSGGLFFAIFGRLPNDGDFTWPRELIALPVLWLGSTVSNYCAVVVAVMADRRLSGETPRLADAIKVANRRLGRIVAWTLVSITVGVILQVIMERLKIAGWLASRLFGLAWALATMFVVPILALEDVGVRDAVKSSASIFRGKWGESVVARGGIGVLSTAAAVVISVIAVAVMTINITAGLVVGAVLFAVLLLVSSALDAVVNVALYRYAAHATIVDGFRPADLYSAFGPKK
jgi:Family of unknown function (DUF6159)